MLAERTDIVGGEFLSLVDVSAHLAAPYRFALRGLSFRLGLDAGLVIGVGRRGDVGQNLHILHRRDKHGVTAQVDGLLHRGTDVGVGAFGDIAKAVFAAPAGGIARKLIRRLAGLEAEMLKQLKVRLLAEDGKIELAALQDHIVGQIGLVHRNADPVGAGGHLPRRIDDTAVILAVQGGGQDKQAVCQVVHRFLIHFMHTPIKSWPRRPRAG